MRISDWSSDVCSSDGNTDSCKGAGGGRLCASIEVHHRTREATGHRIATGERSRDVGRAEADEFLVGINPLPLLRRERLGARNGIDETEDRQQECRDSKQLTHPGVAKRTEGA